MNPIGTRPAQWRPPAQHQPNPRRQDRLQRRSVGSPPGLHGLPPGSHPPRCRSRPHPVQTALADSPPPAGHTHHVPHGITDWAPTVLANIQRLRTGAYGRLHLHNLDCWQRIIETNDLPALRRALTGVDRHNIEMREVTPIAGLLPDEGTPRCLSGLPSDPPP